MPALSQFPKIPPVAGVLPAPDFFFVASSSDVGIYVRSLQSRIRRLSAYLPFIRSAAVQREYFPCFCDSEDKNEVSFSQLYLAGSKEEPRQCSLQFPEEEHRCTCQVLINTLWIVGVLRVFKRWPCVWPPRLRRLCLRARDGCRRLLSRFRREMNINN